MRAEKNTPGVVVETHGGHDLHMCVNVWLHPPVSLSVRMFASIFSILVLISLSELVQKRRRSSFSREKKRNKKADQPDRKQRCIFLHLQLLSHIIKSLGDKRRFLAIFQFLTDTDGFLTKALQQITVCTEGLGCSDLVPCCSQR